MFDAARFVRETIAEFTGRAAPHAVDSALRAGPLYVMGRNPEAAALVARRRVAGIVNDFAAPGSTWNGTPEVRTEDVPRGATVVNASTSISPISARRRLEAIPEARILAYADLTRDPASDLPLPAFVAEAREAFAAHAARWSAVRARLADAESIRIFDTLVAYRLTADIALMEGFRVALHDQYFEPFAAPPPGRSSSTAAASTATRRRSSSAVIPTTPASICSSPRPRTMPLPRRGSPGCATSASCRSASPTPPGASPSPPTPDRRARCRTKARPSST